MKHPGKRQVAVDLRATGRKDPRSEIAGYQRKAMQASRNSTRKSKGSVIALALTWDGARRPARTLPPKARAFLAGPSRVAPSARKMAELFAEDQVREIRVCWVPFLKGGAAVLSEPFQAATGKRLVFRSVKTARFGDVLGVIYRRIKSRRDIRE